MKKIFNMLMASAIAAFTFTACEDVPEPYTNPYDKITPDEPEVVIEPAGEGTATAPYNVAGIIAACNGLADGSFLNDSKDIYVTGIVTETGDISTQYGNATYYISDDAKGSNRFYVYRGKLLDNAAVTAETDIQVGDSVTVCGKVKNYKGTMEFDQGNYLVFYKKGEGGSGSGETPATPGTEEKPLTVAEALTYIDGLGADKQSPVGYVKGKIVAVSEISTSYGNATYTISDDGTDTNTLQIYRGLGLGGEKFTTEDAIKAGDEVIVTGKLVNFKGNTKQFAQGSSIYSLNGKKADNGGGNTPTVTTVGTKDAPKTIAEALTTINAMDDNATSTEFWFVKGKVVKVTTSQANFEKYGNLNYLISADGTETNTITVYSGDGLNGDKFTGIDALQAGDEVIVYGQLQKFVKNDKVTPEIAKGNYLVSLVKNSNGGNDTPDTPSNTGTLDNPLTASQAYDIVATMEKGVTSEADYYVKGKITSIKYTFSAQYGTATFNFSDDGNASDKEFIAYSTYYFGAEQKWVEGNTQVQVGDEVVVCGKVVNYNGNTPEFASKKNYVVKINSQTAASRRK